MHSVLESHLEEICPICRKKHGGNWKADFHGHTHYHTLDCGECGYEILIKTDHFSSGHDDL